VGNDKWALSPAFDLNPFPDKLRESKTWLSEDTGPIDSIGQLLGKAAYFYLDQSQALTILAEVHAAVTDWRQVALSKEVGLSHRELADFAPAFEHVTTIRIGTKALSFWPFRFLTDPDADDLLRLLEDLVRRGKHVAVMAHYNHWRELETPQAREAIRRVRDTGAVIRSQGPVLRHVNDDAGVWSRLWRTQVRLGIQPYYMFVERDTGARAYFELPLADAVRIHRGALRQVSGLARTACGPVMSAYPGKVEVQGVAEVRGERVFVLRFQQARDSDWVGRPFFARFDPAATWLDQLRPAFGETRFFFESHSRVVIDTITGPAATE